MLSNNTEISVFIIPIGFLIPVDGHLQCMFILFTFYFEKICSYILSYGIDVTIVIIIFILS